MTTKGYLTAGAEFKLQKAKKTNHFLALYTISEGPKVSIDKIIFHGNNAFHQGKLRGVFKETVQNSWWRKIFGSPKLDRDKLAEDKNLLVDFYRNNGYRDARILRDEISYTKNKKGLYLDIYLDEGPNISSATSHGQATQKILPQLIFSTPPLPFKKGISTTQRKLKSD